MTARVIGLTGAIGSGKSTVLALASEVPGVVTLSADALVHQILGDPKHPVVQSIAVQFGADLLSAKGVDRKQLGQRVFGDAQARQTLENLLHPAVRVAMLEQIAASMDRARVILVEVPLLFETGMHSMFAETWAILSDAQIRSDRVQKRDGVNHEDFLARNNLQVDDAARKSLATHLLTNHGDLSELKEQVLHLLALD